MENCKSILEKLSSQEPSEVREACFLVGEENCREGIPLLVELLKYDNVGVQEAAELSIRKLGGEESVEALIPLLWEEDVVVRNIAIDILRDIGDQGIDLLLDLLYENDEDIRIFAVDILGYTKNVMVVRSLCDILFEDPDPNVKSQAAISLGKLGYLEAVPCLERALEDEEWVKFSAIEALKKIGSESSAETLINYLGKGSDLIDSAIIDALGEMGKIRVVPVLLNKLATNNIPLRNKVIQALVNLMGKRTLEILDKSQREKFESYLLVALSDEDRDVQFASLTGLSFIGGEKAANAVFEYALTLDKERDEELLEQVKDILIELGVGQAIVDAVSSEDEDKVLLAIELLCRMEDKKALNALSKVFWEKHRDLQREIASCLGNKTDPILKDLFLRILREHKDAKVIKCALKFLGEKIRCHEAEKDIIRFLDHPYDDVKEVALDACVSLGTKFIKDKFLDMFEDSEPLHRFMAVYAFGRFKDPVFLPYIKHALSDEVSDIRKVAVESFASCARSEEEIIDTFLPCLKDSSKEVRLTTLEVFSGLKAKGYLKDQIIALLDDEDEWVKIRAIELLGDIKEDIDPYILEPFLYSENSLIKLKTIDTLDRIGGEKTSKILLKFLEKEDDPEVQRVVEKVLAKGMK